METLDEFKNSFFCGRRKDLLLKFLKNFLHAENMKLARALVTRRPMSRPMGAALDAERHELVMRRALSLLESARDGGIIEELEEPYRTAPCG